MLAGKPTDVADLAQQLGGKHRANPEQLDQAAPGLGHRGRDALLHRLDPPVQHPHIGDQVGGELPADSGRRTGRPYLAQQRGGAIGAQVAAGAGQDQIGQQPMQPVDRLGAHAHQVLAAIGQQLHHHRVVLDHDLPQPRSAARGNRDRPLPERLTVHLDAGYDDQPYRQVLTNPGMVGQIATRGCRRRSRPAAGGGRSARLRGPTSTQAALVYRTPPGRGRVLAAAGLGPHRGRSPHPPRLDHRPLGRPPPPPPMTTDERRPKRPPCGLARNDRAARVSCAAVASRSWSTRTPCAGSCSAGPLVRRLGRSLGRRRGDPGRPPAIDDWGSPAELTHG